MALSVRRICRCSHSRDAHQHYRRGSDCASCGCDRYRFGLVITLGGAPVPTVVTPEVVHEVTGPYVRPNHANLRSPQVPPLPRVPDPVADAQPRDRVR